MDKFNLGDSVIVSEGAGVITHISEPFLKDSMIAVKVGDVYLWKYPQDLTKIADVRKVKQVIEDEIAIDDETDGMFNLIRDNAPDLLTAYESGDVDGVFEVACVFVEAWLEALDDAAQVRDELAALKVQNALNLIKLHKLQNKHVR